MRSRCQRRQSLRVFKRNMPAFASGRLTLHSANLDEPGVFDDDIFAGCHGVAHVSHVSNYNDQDYVKMVCDHMIESVNKARTVGRVVVTSSIAAVISEMDLAEIERRPTMYEDRYPDELNPRVVRLIVKAIQWVKSSRNGHFPTPRKKAASGMPSRYVPQITWVRFNRLIKKIWARGNTISK